MYNYLFGPVPSRRLGMSLGVDLVPSKVCSLDCVYCEVGKTTKLTLDRMEYIPARKVIAELDDYFSTNSDPDYFTFSGAGEPTLNVSIEIIIDHLKNKKPSIPIAVLTNGTLLFDKEVRKALLKADLILPSLDAASQETFEKLNRPAKHLSVKKHIQGLIDFSKEYTGRIWLEVFILPGYNTHRSELLAIKEIIDKIEPELIQLNTLDRPGTIDGLRSASAEELQEVIDLWQLENVRIIAAAPQRKKIQSFRNDIETAILETISRRPCTLDDLSEIVGLHVNEVNKYLDVLEADQKIKSVRQERGIFYQLKEKK